MSRVYRYDPADHSVRVYARNHNAARVIGYGPHDANPYYHPGISHMILCDARGTDFGKQFWADFGKEVIDHKNFSMRWEITEDEISVWVAARRERLDAES